jgi:hypothetical protein
MAYRILGALHARLLSVRAEAGQGTVEYVALILLIAVILGAAVTALGHTDNGIGAIIVSKIKSAISSVGPGK